MVGYGDVGVFSAAGRCRACFPEDAFYRQRALSYSACCLGYSPNWGVLMRRGVSLRAAHRFLRGQGTGWYVRDLCSWRHRIEGCTVRLRAASPEALRFSRSFPFSVVKGVAYGEDLRWFRRSVVKEDLYGEIRKPFTDRKAPFAEHGGEDASRFSKGERLDL